MPIAKSVAVSRKWAPGRASNATVSPMIAEDAEDEHPGEHRQHHLHVVQGEPSPCGAGDREPDSRAWWPWHQLPRAGAWLPALMAAMSEIVG
jgi:hypothetical protein